MNRPLDFNLQVTKFSPTSSGSTFQYHVQITSGPTLSWEVIKRFSDFDRLLDQLDSQRYGCLPKLPPKTLARPLDVESATERQRLLQVLLHEILRRPDLRNSTPLKDFLEIEAHIPTLGDVDLQPQIMRSFEDMRYSASGIVPVPNRTIVLAVHQDNSSLSRLGRVWSIVEPDELGVFHLWQHGEEKGWERKDDVSCHQKPVCTLYDDATDKVFAGFDNGQVKILGIDMERSMKKIFANDAVQMHHLASVVDMSLGGGRLLSIGYDSTLRLLDTSSHGIVGGGKLGKRLPEDTYLTTCFLDSEQDRAFLGSSGYDVFVFSVANNPPEFLFHYKFPLVDLGLNVVVSHSQTNLLPIPLDGRYVAGIGKGGNTMAFAHSNVVTIFPYMARNQEQRMFDRKIVDFSAYEDSHIVDLQVAADRSILVAGFSNGGIAMWNYDSPSPILVVQAHEGGVSRILWLDSLHPWGPALLSGGNEGKIHTWSFQADVFNDYHHWKADPQFLAAANKEAPRIVGKSTFATTQVLATAATAATDSPEKRPLRVGGLSPGQDTTAPTLRQPDEEDSDDDLKGVF
ncbi:unnamed protein product [Amoebophrya sp. A120]|nr:unnamed protein product [Amoebophrya sp. A120]|eukprot:GSA120T00019992001.1